MASSLVGCFVTSCFVISLAYRPVSQQIVINSSTLLEKKRERVNMTSGSRWSADTHNVAWKAAALAYSNSAVCKNYGKNAGKPPVREGCSNAGALDTAGGPSVFAWTCEGYGLIMAIRGTDLGPKGDCVENDLKADHDLFDLKHIASAGLGVNEMSKLGVAYAMAVKGFIESVGKPDMLTGHSLGAGLAVKMAQLGVADPGSVYAFAPPPLGGSMPSGMNVMYNSNDPVHVAVQERGGADGCVFDGATHEDCAACHAALQAGGYDASPGVIWPNSQECENCWHAAHELGPYSPRDAGAAGCQTG